MMSWMSVKRIRPVLSIYTSSYLLRQYCCYVFRVTGWGTGCGSELILDAYLA